MDSLENELKRGRDSQEEQQNGSTAGYAEETAIVRHDTADNDHTNSSTTNNSNDTNIGPSFMATMTFASSGGAGAARGGCDCDDCGGPGAGLYTPQAIIDAIRAHKRKRNEYQPMKRTQQRDLVARHGPISVYKWTMPVNADPLVEFGTAHRLIWIRSLSEDVRKCHRLHLWYRGDLFLIASCPSFLCSAFSYFRKSSSLKTIGKGIVGSQAEEQGRQDLSSWNQGDVYLLPSNGGKAVALLHNSKNTTGDSRETKDNESGEPSTSDSGSNASSSSSGHAIIYICKIPQDLVANTANTSSPQDGSNENAEGDTPEWRRLIHSICSKSLESFENENKEKEDGLKYQKLSDIRSAQLRAGLSKL